MPIQSPVVDADGHILEPPDLWQRYLEKKYVDRAIRLDHDESGLEVLVFDDQIVERQRGFLGALGGVQADDPEERLALMTPGKRTYRDGWAAGSNDPGVRLKVMDNEGIDISLLYPSIGIYWEGWVRDPALASAYTRAYNRWLVDFCNTDRGRLKPVAHISLLDPAAACEEVRRARSDGCIGVMLSPDPLARNGKMLSDPELDGFWSTLEDLDMPFAFHVVVRPHEQEMLSRMGWAGAEGYSGQSDMTVMNFAFLSLGVMAAFTQMVSAAVFEKFPRLRCAVLETGATWISAWLDRMDVKYETMKARTPMKRPASEYFLRHCVISADPDESTIADAVRHIGADYFIWASDYPHIDASTNVLGELKHHIAGLSPEDQAKVLGGSAVRFYDL
jgi:predicted TIM-barrel fold metal-dependent hydrolase